MAAIEDREERNFSVPACSDFVQKQKRVLSELKDQANLLPKRVKIEQSSHDSAIECQQVVDEFKKLKFAFVHLQSRIKLLDHLENVPRDQWPSVASCDEESKEIRRHLKDAKSEASDLEEVLRTMMAEVQKCQETLDVNLESLEKMTDEVQETTAELQQLLETRKNTAVLELDDSDINVENFHEKNKKMKEDLQAAEEFLVKHKPVLKSIREGTDAIRKQHKSLMAQTKRSLEVLSQRIAEKKNEKQRQSDKMKWCESASKMLTQLTGVSEQSFEDNCWTLELTTAGCNPSNKEGMTALLALHFTPGTEAWSPAKLSRATIDVDTLDISDLVEEAVRRNDATFLVLAVMKRLKTHAPLFMEVEQLRHQYAIDWVPEDGILRVIFGDSAQIVCTLSLTTGPQGSTIVQLKTIEGVAELPPVEDLNLKPPQEEARISDWLEHLQKVLENL